MYRPREIFEGLVQTGRPSGYEQPTGEWLMHILAPYVNDCIVDIHGNLICRKRGVGTKENQTIMFVAHMDEIGLMVSYIEESGYIRFSKIGGVDLRLLKGRNVIIMHEGSEVRGVIGATPIHMRKSGDCKETDESDLWIDIGVQGKEAVEKIVSIGDCIVTDSLLVEMSNGIISSRGCDNQAGVAALVGMLDLLKDVSCELDIVVVCSVQEEVGLRGAKTASYSVSPDICISVDVVHATDYPTVNKSKYGDIRIGNGPVIPLGTDFTFSIQRYIKELSVRMDIKCQSLAMSGTSGTDSGAVQVCKAGCATGLVGIPCRYMHTPVEIVSLNDIEDTSLILAEFCKTRTLLSAMTVEKETI